MLTLFAVPKPFEGHIGLIQRNALQSWIRLDIPKEVILFGNEDGIASAAAQFGVQHVREIVRNDFGTPLLSDLFRQAQQRARYSTLCYVNADILLLDDFVRAVNQVAGLKHPFLLCGRRWDIDQTQPIAFCQGWVEELRCRVVREGRQQSTEYIDYFVFPKEMFPTLPDFAIGRAAFDNWLLWRAQNLGADLIDASDAIYALHQNHSYSHVAQGKQGAWQGPEAQRNRMLMGGWHHCFTIADASHRLTHMGIKRRSIIERLPRLLQMAKRTLAASIKKPFGIAQRRASADFASVA